MTESRMELAQRLMARHKQLADKRAVWDSLWQDVANYVMPRKSYISHKTDTPGAEKHAQLFDTTAIQSNQILAAGRMSWMTPKDDRWFSYDPPEEFEKNEEVKQWFSRCTEIAEMEIARSNFYTETHEDDLDSGCFGTSCLYLEEGSSRLLNFRSLDVGSFSIAENAEGLVDTVSRCMKMTVRQAVQKFGEENVSKEVREAYNDKGGKKLEEEIEIIHWIAPRSDYDPTKNDGPNKPIASCYIEAKTNHILREGGYHEHPCAVSRFLKWGSFGYGWSPSMWALPEARQLNFLVKSMDVLGEVAAFPRMLFPSDHEGAINVGAHGVTYWDASVGKQPPTEWLTAGQYDIGKDREEQKRKAIQDAFFVPLFRMLEQFPPGKEFTATEIIERRSEKVDQFSPTFARSINDKLDPILCRVWGILIRSGRFPEVPRDLVKEGPFGYYLPDPRISYNSRIALAIKERNFTAFMRNMDLRLSLADVLGPAVFDDIDVEAALSDISRIQGLPHRWRRDQDAIAQIKAARAEAQAREQELADAERRAKIAKDAGSVKPDSVMGREMQEAA